MEVDYLMLYMEYRWEMMSFSKLWPLITMNIGQNPIDIKPFVD